MINELFQLLNIDVLTFLHWMFAISITLFILDMFIQTEFVSWLALLLFSIYFTLLLEANFDLPTQWLLLVFILFLSLAFVFYYAIWSKLVSPIIKKSLLRKATVEYADRAAGQIGIFRRIDDNSFVEWDGQLWQASSSQHLSQFQDREEVLIGKSELGKLTINKK